MWARVDDNGKISVMHLKVPLALALGLYEKLTDEQLQEHHDDIKAELERRSA